MSLFGHVMICLGPDHIGTMKLFVKEAPDGDALLKHILTVRNQTVADGYGHDGHCPPGEYYLGDPEPCDPPEVPYGHFFTPVLDVYGLWTPYGRAGIGVHGGGSGLADPFAPLQGWQITEGCFRLQNIDNDSIFVPFVRYVRAHALEDQDRAVKMTVAMAPS